MTVLRNGLFINGTCGAGKTTIAAAVAGLVADAGEAVAFVDMDALGQSWPRHAEDPFNKALATRNLAAVAQNFSDAGVTSVVIAGVIQDDADLARYENALNLRLTVVRLSVPLEEIDERLRSRHGQSDPEGMEWHRRRAPELDQILDDSVVETIEVPNTAPVPEVARALLSACGWQLQK